MSETRDEARERLLTAIMIYKGSHGMGPGTEVVHALNAYAAAERLATLAAVEAEARRRAEDLECINEPFAPTHLRDLADWCRQQREGQPG